MSREKGLQAEQTQVGIYEAAPEEGASTTQTPLAEGPPPGIWLQARNKVRQRYIVSEEQAEVASRPPEAAKVRPANHHVRSTGRRCSTPGDQPLSRIFLYCHVKKWSQSALGLGTKETGPNYGKKKSQ